VSAVEDVVGDGTEVVPVVVDGVVDDVDVSIEVGLVEEVEVVVVSALDDVLGDGAEVVPVVVDGFVDEVDVVMEVRLVEDAVVVVVSAAEDVVGDGAEVVPVVVDGFVDEVDVVMEVGLVGDAVVVAIEFEVLFAMPNVGGESRYLARCHSCGTSWLCIVLSVVFSSNFSNLVALLAESGILT
ncbi:unnamed protein product, partial [Thelazia callipaeda]|uniref:Dynein heavy chain n=1 Tax=Thelazia callipaeda TaxID=103827 RepID=A0A0N5DA66_THECL